MRSVALVSLVAALAAQQAASHATFQDLWVNGVDEQAYCARLPPSNNPVTDVTSNDIRCNVNGARGVPNKCVVSAGSTVTVEMHQQPGDRSCANEAIGGDHFGPVHVYLSKVDDSSTADGSDGWFKIFSDTWSHLAGSSNGQGDNWGTKDLNNCCGRMNVKIPSDIPAGDYLLRAEVIALHVASSPGGAQLYMSCFQLTITGGGSASPALVNFPGAYKATDPGILINIYQPLSTYVDPGPAVYSGGSTKSAGAGCAGVETGTAPGPTYTGGGGGSGPTGGSTTTTRGQTTTTTLGTTTRSTTTARPTTTSAPGGSCSVPKYGQCGGQPYTGCTVCASGSTCSAVSPPYYYQCL
ncbi:glycosyl hydrolase family 61-domain-containing protein [Xylogone sp. PMI_703]|nr:glycosyl hydrolase family 61-domain-containing protein [Xylogone sp. PMI_703]